MSDLRGSRVLAGTGLLLALIGCSGTVTPGAQQPDTEPDATRAESTKTKTEDDPAALDHRSSNAPEASSPQLSAPERGEDPTLHLDDLPDGVELMESDTGPVARLDETLLGFPLDSAKPSQTGRQVLAEVAAAIRAGCDEPALTVVGHASADGEADYNRRLSRRRAARVAEILTGLEISPSAIAHRGVGADQPIADNDTESGRRANRRVEIHINGC